MTAVLDEKQKRVISKTITQNVKAIVLVKMYLVSAGRTGLGVIAVWFSGV